MNCRDVQILLHDCRKRRLVPALEDTEPRLRGGSVGYVFDRRAAVLVYALRQHLLTLLVFRAKGLAWPDVSAGQVGPARGFNVVLWRGGDWDMRSSPTPTP